MLSCTAASADDIWEPEPEIINPVTIPDIFSWGDKLKDVYRFLKDYEYYYDAEIEQYEDELCDVISFSGKNYDEDYTYSFMFDRDSGELWQIQTSTVYIQGDSASDVLDSICDFYGMDQMADYYEPKITGHAESKFDGYRIAADDGTIYYGGYDRYNYSQFGQRVFFTFIDRNYYESLLKSLDTTD